MKWIDTIDFVVDENDHRDVRGIGGRLTGHQADYPLISSAGDECGCPSNRRGAANEVGRGGMVGVPGRAAAGRRGRFRVDASWRPAAARSEEHTSELQSRG